MKIRVVIVSFYIISLLAINGCISKEKEINKVNRFDTILQTKFPNHFPKNTVDALLLRNIIEDYAIQKDSNELISYIKQTLEQEILPIDSTIYHRIINRIDSDEKLIADCIYLRKVLNCNEKYVSKHFNVYNLNSTVNQQEIELYDQQYDELKKVFQNTNTIRLNLVLDTTLNYWRAFPIWNVKYGLLQRYINGNPHELVHHFFTQYSDVPFFQEPMAFLYGDYKNDTTKFYKKYTKLYEDLSINEYIKAKSAWHFPAIVILEKEQKLSFWLFTSTLMQKYGIEKFIEFASITTWDKSNDDFENNFKHVYGLSLNEFEQTHILQKLKK